MQTPLPWTTGHCVGLARALHICSSLLMKPNHKLPMMLYALALVSTHPRFDTLQQATIIIFALAAVISQIVSINVDCRSSSWLLCVMPPSFTAMEATMHVGCFTEHALISSLTLCACTVYAENSKAVPSTQAQQHAVLQRLPSELIRLRPRLIHVVSCRTQMFQLSCNSGYRAWPI